MRFVPDGPVIPNTLLADWRAGRVVFLAGAGVSVPAPASLPLFRRLVLDVYESMHDTLSPVLAAADKPGADRNAVLCASGLHARQRVEANLFFNGDFDRVFSAMEARLDQDPKGRVISMQVRNAVEARLRSHSGHSQGHRDLVRLSTILGPTRGIEAILSCRIATTNFDLLLEDACEAELGHAIRSVDARMAPRPGAFNFEGILHLHGKLDSNPNIPGDLILSSRDFARVYLRNAVVANFVYDLVRRFTIVLVGYSADDPTMRYLMDAIGEDAALFDDMNKPYAIAGRNQEASDSTGEVYAQTWRSKNIEPIVYDCRETGERHGPLWETLSQWAEWARRGMDWVNERLVAATATPPSMASPFSQGIVEDLLAILDPSEQKEAIEAMQSAGADFAWIDTIAAAADASVGSIGGGS